MATSLTTRAAAPCLSVVDGIVTTLSTHIAALFGKAHRDVLRAIENLIAQLEPERLRNFAQASVEVRQPNGGTATYPAYRLTRDGFTLLAMGFTGKRALQFKLAYIDAFNRMEAELREQHSAQAATPAAAAPALPTQAPTLRGQWLVGRALDGSEHATKLGEGQFVTSWSEIAADMRAERVPAEHRAALSEAAALCLFRRAPHLPPGRGADVARAIREAGDQLSVADLHEIAVVASGQLWAQTVRDKAGANAKAREVLRALPGARA